MLVFFPVSVRVPSFLQPYIIPLCKCNADEQDGNRGMDTQNLLTAVRGEGLDGKR